MKKIEIKEKQLQVILAIMVIITLSFECFLSVLEQTRIYSGLIELGSVVLPMMAMVILCVCIVYMKEKKNIDRFNLLLAILLALSVVISFFFSKDKNAAISGHNLHSEGVMVCLSYIVFFYAGTLMFEKNILKILYWGLTGIAIFQVLWGIIQAIIQPAFLHDFLSTLYYPSYRAAGTMENPNCYGSFLIIALGIETIIFWNCREKKKSVFHGGLIIIYSFALFLSGTRGALVGYGTAALVGVIFIFKYSNADKMLSLKKILFVLICISCGFLLLCTVGRETVNDLSERMENEIQVSSASQLGENRIEIWKKSVIQGLRNPVFGLGISQLEMEINMGDFMLTTYDAHNRYIQIFATQGLFGIVIYLVINVIIIIRTTKKIKTDFLIRRIFTFAVFMAYIAYMVADLFCIGTYALAPYIYIIMGILVTSDKIINVDGEQNE